MWSLLALLLTFDQCLGLTYEQCPDLNKIRVAPPNYIQQQAFIQYSSLPASQIVGNSLVSKNITFKFDDIDLNGSANQTLKSGHVPFLEFEKYIVANTTNAASRGYMNDEDVNCANSTPNAIIGVPSTFASPSIIRVNATTVAQHNLSEFFDFRSLYIKPVNKTTPFASVEINAWEIADGEAKNVYSLGIGFLYTGNFDMPNFAPPEYFPGWGERVNWVEIKATDGEGEPINFCVDNLVLDFHDAKK